MVTDLIRSRGQHRLTYSDRFMVWLRFRLYYVPFWIVALFWGLVVAGSGFVAGWVWAQAMS